ncbi:hypothetical protein NDU88_004337 [Pleurodeles waltl]|uniref:Uncharacterized protein n=1 Tax=Pleurodeles waltl TaxID=8319 RepID=A0AAV7LL38_PLEWA|nr:hypothetical protein NDU88_004337 [Pleurodeles waltl]
MGHHKWTDASQGKTMEQYTTPVALLRQPAGLEALEGKTETVAVEVNLLRADLWKVSDKMKLAEGSIVEQQSEVGTLRTQMAQATSTVGRLEVRQARAAFGFRGGVWLRLVAASCRCCCWTRSLGFEILFRSATCDRGFRWAVLRLASVAPFSELRRCLFLLTAGVATLCRFQISRKRAAAGLPADTSPLR